MTVDEPHCRISQLKAVRCVLSPVCGFRMQSNEMCQCQPKVSWLPLGCNFCRSGLCRSIQFKGQALVRFGCFTKMNFVLLAAIFSASLMPSRSD
jgi:hypothetical protein